MTLSNFDWQSRRKVIWGLKRTFALLAPGAMLFLLAAQPALAQDPPHHAKFDAEVDAAVHRNDSARVIVQFADTVSRETGRNTATSYGASVRRDLNSLVALSITATASAIDSLALAPGVTHVSLDAPISASDNGPSQGDGQHSDGDREARQRF